MKSTDAPIEVAIEGMTCASCAARVEKALNTLPDVSTAAVNLATERATVHGTASFEALRQAIEKAGYSAHPVASTAQETAAAKEKKAAEGVRIRRDLVLAAALTLPVFVLEMGAHIIPSMHAWISNTIGMQNSWYLQFVLTLLVLAVPGRRFFSTGIPALVRRAPDMNALVAVGTSAAFGYSTVATFAPSVLPEGTANVYFEAAAMIIVLVLLGRYLESRAKGRTSEAIQRLVGLQPNTARVHRNGKIESVPIEQVKVNDVLEIQPGARVAVDGEVLDGESYVDESMITGEPVPTLKRRGQRLVAGTMNQKGSLTLRATAVGSETLLAQIIRMVEQAQGAKLPIQSWVDKITLWFVPAVMAAATLTFLIWLVFGPTPALAFALVNAVAVLIIACPCAMGLATPTSIMVGTGRGAELGILFRKGEALQTLKDVQVVAFDKTGTLTEGKPVLADLEVMSGYDANDVLAKVAAVESRSEHPIAGAIVAAAEARALALGSVSQFESVTGFGVRADVDGTRIEVGADRFMRQLKLDISAFAATAARMAEEAKSPIYVAIDGALVAVLAVADQVKPGTRSAIASLHAQGLKVAMISGDNQRTAEAIAKQLGIDEVIAEVLPDGKVTAVRRLRKAHGVVAFIGDGINDAPALAEADIGIAVGSGTDIAMESADVVLMSGNLHTVRTAIALSKATLKNIRQNLFWAFGYNVALIPIAAGVLYPFNGVLLSPVFAAGAMALSSVFVLGNALRLRRFQPEVMQVIE